jgi:hypothetical protein
MSQNRNSSQPHDSSLNQNSQEVKQPSQEVNDEKDKSGPSAQETEAKEIIGSIDPDKEMNYYENMFDRLIIHIDMDAYYAQVESKRHGIKDEEPMGVLQWKSLIALNYAAKARGIKRQMTATEALGLCSELKLVHVGTIVD